MSVFLLVFGVGFFVTFISLKLDYSGVPDSGIAIVLSCYFAGQFLGAFIVEPLFRFVGHIRAFATTASLSGITVLIMALDDSLAVWIPMRFIAGFCLSVQYIVVESWLLEIGDKMNRGRVLAIYMITLYGSLALSQLMIDFIDLNSSQAFLITAIFVVFSVIPICFSPYETPRVPDVHTYSIKKLIQQSPYGLLGSFLSGMILASIYGFFPLYAIAYEMPVSWVMFTTVAGGIVLQWPIGKLSDVLDRRTVLTVISGLLIIPSLLLWLFPDSFQLVLVLAFLVGGISFTIYPLSIAEVSDRFHGHHLTRIATVLLIFYEVGSILGPLLAAASSYFLGIGGIFVFIAINSALLCLFGVARSVWISPVPMDEQHGFIAMPPATPVAYELANEDTIEL